jgi:hypothetical protein
VRRAFARARGATPNRRTRIANSQLPAERLALNGLSASCLRLHEALATTRIIADNADLTAPSQANTRSMTDCRWILRAERCSKSRRAPGRDRSASRPRRIRQPLPDGGRPRLAKAGTLPRQARRIGRSCPRRRREFEVEPIMRKRRHLCDAGHQDIHSNPAANRSWGLISGVVTEISPSLRFRSPYSCNAVHIWSR